MLVIFRERRLFFPDLVPSMDAGVPAPNASTRIFALQIKIVLIPRAIAGWTPVILGLESAQLFLLIARRDSSV